LKMRRAKRTKRKGVVLLTVLFIVMAITVLSLGYLARSDVELACGSNMVLHSQMDYLAESGLEHARGLILSPQDLGPEDSADGYWLYAMEQQLTDGSNDYYDVAVEKTGGCNYEITCEAYRISDGYRIGRSSLFAELRLDGAIGLWLDSDSGATLSQGFTINSDVYCAGTLVNNGVINGDVFAQSSIGSGSISGQQKTVGGLSLKWPAITATDYISRYAGNDLGRSVSGGTYGPYDPIRICRRSGDLDLNGSVVIDGMLIVDGDLVIRGSGNILKGGKNLPAFFVTGNVLVESGGELDVKGLGVVEGKMQVGGGSVVTVVGGLFVAGGIYEVTNDSSGGDNVGVLYGGPVAFPSGGQTGGGFEFDGSNDKIEDGDAEDYLNGLAEVTISLWVKSDVAGQDRGLIYTREPTSSDIAIGLRYDASGAYGGAQNCIKASLLGSSGYTQIESTSNVQTTDWQHLGLVWASGESLKLYINGEPNVPLSYDRGPVSGTVTGIEKLMVGCDTKNQYWDGMIDDVRIYDRALDPNELYPPSDAIGGLLLHWKLDETSTSAIIQITADPSKTAILFWDASGDAQKWSQAAGGFFRSVERR